MTCKISKKFILCNTKILENKRKCLERLDFHKKIYQKSTVLHAAFILFTLADTIKSCRR